MRHVNKWRKMTIIKCIKQIRVPRWSSCVAFIFYIVFMLFILTISFPLRSSNENYKHFNFNEKNNDVFAETEDTSFKIDKVALIKEFNLNEASMPQTVIKINSNAKQLIIKAFHR